MPPQPPQVFSISGLRLCFPMLELRVVQSVTQSTSCCLAASCSFAHPAPQSAKSLGPPASALLRVLSTRQPVSAPLPVWMHVSSLCPWRSDLHRVRFSVSSGCFLFLNCCCPSFGCARRHRVSTYASILGRGSNNGWTFSRQTSYILL